VWVRACLLTMSPWCSVLDSDQAEKLAVEYLKKKKPNSSTITVQGVEPSLGHRYLRVKDTFKDEQGTAHDFWVQVEKRRGTVEGWSVTEKETGKPIQDAPDEIVKTIREFLSRTSG
jgi:hypothetical protein